MRGCYIQPVLVVLPGVEAGQTVQVQMRVWNAAAGSTYEQAEASARGVIGQSPRLFSIAGDTIVPGDLKGVTGLSVFPVPEPSALLLLSLSAAGLCLFCKRPVIRI